MPPAKVEPLHFRQVRAELFFERGNGHRKSVRILFAQRVHMQPVQQRQHGRVELSRRYAETGAGRTRVVDRMPLLRGTLRIDAQPDALARRLGARAERFELRTGIEYDMIRVR